MVLKLQCAAVTWSSCSNSECWVHLQSFWFSRYNVGPEIFLISSQVMLILGVCPYQPFQLCHIPLSCFPAFSEPPDLFHPWGSSCFNIFAHIIPSGVTTLSLLWLFNPYSTFLYHQFNHYVLWKAFSHIPD